MAIKMSQNLKQMQSLVMTPQLQQAIKLLTLTHLEMSNLITSEMIENPMLEEFGNEISIDDKKNEVDYNLEKLDKQNKEIDKEKLESPSLLNEKDDFDWGTYIDSFNSNSSSPPPSMATQDFDDIPNYENIVSLGAGLHEHLEWQLRMESLTEDEWKVAHYFIHNINDEGYLEISLKEAVEETGHDAEDAAEILSMIQNLDPVGCGSRSLVECLLVQARSLDVRMPLVEKVIESHLEELHQKNYQSIAKTLGVGKDLVKEAEVIILSFNPKPGRLVSNDHNHYIVPDIYVVDVGGELQVKLNDEGVPRLRVSKLYQNMIKGKNKDDAEREYVEDKLRSAVWLIKSIQNRQKTIHKVAEAIIKHQPEFFKKGSAFLKPMILKDIAGEIGVHESTVSRVTTNKYVHTPLGIYELKYFFNSGVGGKNGGVDIASESLKIKIKKMIEEENSRKPYSDQKIVELLLSEDIKVARRTVAKYREALNILPSSKRKKLG
jgi:RNA polymerase sigma-54 factor